jgi:catechol 2,3-dioxygenase-like lactoylglutathione lyase family enzyme
MRLESLDFVYIPSRDPAAELDWFETTLGAEVLFAIEAFGTRVAMLRAAGGTPFLLAGHLEGERPVLVFRVESLDEAAAELAAGGATVTAQFDIPHGPIREVEAPGGHRIAIYELTRPEVPQGFRGRRDW